jgi:L,D-peptidoglycan transpeptidase YkuD (ErfK/YbiS/YcfS/YnhG family)
MRRRVVLIGMAAALALTSGVAATAASGSAASPRATAATAAVARPRQVVTVSAPSATATTARLAVYELDAAGRYRRVAGPWSARVGYHGVGRAHEGSGRTPAGVWPLGVAFGVGTKNPGTRLPWFTATSRDVWGSDVRSPATYNRHVRCARGACPLREAHAERLVNYPVAYRYAIFIGYNAPPHAVIGAGSAFFLHVGTGSATAGCVSVSRARVVWLLRRLTPGAVVSIGVGAKAYAPVR